VKKYNLSLDNVVWITSSANYQCVKDRNTLIKYERFRVEMDDDIPTWTSWTMLEDDYDGYGRDVGGGHMKGEHF
jgi:hypothetical protein